MNIRKTCPCYRLLKGLALVYACTVLLSGCAPMDLRRDIPATTMPKTPDISLPDSYQPTLGSAASLYHQANHEAATGNYTKAEQLLERALRIEPKNSYYWYMLARIKFKQHHYPQVIQLCLKSKSIAGSDNKLVQMNDKLISQAQNRLP